MTARDHELLGRSAVLYLMLTTSLGIHLAFALVVVVGVVTLWALACRRWPLFAIFTLGFVRGLFRRDDGLKGPDGVLGLWAGAYRVF